MNVKSALLIAAVVCAAFGSAAAVSVRLFDGSSTCTGPNSFILEPNDKPCFPAGDSASLAWDCESASPTSAFTFKYFPDSTCSGNPAASIPGTSGTCLTLGSSSHLVNCAEMPVQKSIDTPVTFLTQSIEPCDLHLHCNANQCCSFGDHAIFVKCASASTDSLWQANFYGSTTCEGAPESQIAGDNAQCASIGNFTVDCTGGGPSPIRPTLPSTYHFTLNATAQFPGSPVVTAPATMDVQPGSSVLDTKYGKYMPSVGCVENAKGQRSSFDFNSVTKTCNAHCINGQTCSPAGLGVASGGDDDDDSGCNCSPGLFFTMMPFAAYKGSCPDRDSSTTYWVGSVPGSSSSIEFCWKDESLQYLQFNNKGSGSVSSLPPSARSLVEAVNAALGNGGDDDDGPQPLFVRYEVLSASTTVNPAAFDVPSYCKC